MPEMAGAGFGSGPTVLGEVGLGVVGGVSSKEVLIDLLEGVVVDLVESNLFGGFPFDAS